MAIKTTAAQPIAQLTPASTVRRVLLRGAANVAAIRTATFEGREHLVVPVVALMEGVIQASNAATPEFVPADAIEKSVAGWNGRPILPNHPIIDGINVSANEPSILDAQAFGLTFAAATKKKRLLMEAWLDLTRAAKVGKLAQRVVERAKAGDRTIEVSVGAFVVTEAQSGVYKGASYAAIWRDIIPDHLAMLPEGVPGACSIEMGCGAPRAAAAAVSTTGSATEPAATATTEPTYAYSHNEDEDTDMKPTLGLRDRLLSILGLAAPRAAADDATGPSDSDLRGAIDRALYSSEPGYLGIDDVFPADGLVVYAVAPEGALVLYRRGFTAADDGAVTLAADKEEVRPVKQYVAVTAAQAVTQQSTTAQPVTTTMTPGTTAACGCAHAGSSNNTTAASAGGGETNMKTKQDRVKALIACQKTPYTDADETALMSMSEDRLTALEAFHSALPATQPIATTTPQPAAQIQPIAAAAAPAPATVSEEDFLKAHPAIAAIVTEHRASQAAQHTTLVASVKALAHETYTDAELDAMDNGALAKLERALKSAQPAAPQTSFVGRGLPRDAAAQSAGIEAAPSLVAAVRSLQGQPAAQ